MSLFFASAESSPEISAILCARDKAERCAGSTADREVGGRESARLDARGCRVSYSCPVWLSTPLPLRRCLRDGMQGSFLIAAAAATPSPPFRRAFFLRSSALSNASLTLLRLRTGGSLMISAAFGCDVGRKIASLHDVPVGDCGGVGSAGAVKTFEFSGSALMLNTDRGSTTTA